jgi:hypothetical protein
MPGARPPRSCGARSWEPAQLAPAVLWSAARSCLAAERQGPGPRGAAEGEGSCSAARASGRTAEADRGGGRPSAARKMCSAARIARPLSCAGPAPACPFRGCAALGCSRAAADSGFPTAGRARRPPAVNIRVRPHTSAWVLACGGTPELRATAHRFTAAPRAAAHLLRVPPHTFSANPSQLLLRRSRLARQVPPRQTFPQTEPNNLTQPAVCPGSARKNRQWIGGGCGPIPG